MRLIILLAVGMAAWAASCAVTTSPPAGREDNAPTVAIRIVVHQSVYTPDDASQAGIKATVTNASARNFYARVGDRMNGALDQPNIWAAVGTHAVIERLTSSGSSVPGWPGSSPGPSQQVWVDANAALLIEGSRYVVLSSGKSYELTGTIAPHSPGTYRIRLDYSPTNNDASPTLPFHEYSATFEVR